MYRKTLVTFIIAIISALLLTGCQYDFPEDSKKKPHTYEEALIYIQEYFNRDDIILSDETISGVTEYGDHYTNYFASVDNISFIVSSQERCHYDRTGEFCKSRYNLYNNYNYENISLIFEGNLTFPNFELILETESYLHIYNTTYFNYTNVVSNETDLLSVFEESKCMYEWMTTLYPNPRYCVIIQIENFERPLYICAHKSTTTDVEFGFNEASLNAVIDEYRKFYE